MSDSISMLESIQKLKEVSDNNLPSIIYEMTSTTFNEDFKMYLFIAYWCKYPYLIHCKKYTDGSIIKEEYIPLADTIVCFESDITEEEINVGLKIGYNQRK